MSFLRLGPTLVASSSSALAFRSLSTAAPRLATAGAPKGGVHAADVVAGAVSGPITEHKESQAIAAEVVSDAPSELRYRQVRIYKPTKSTMQSAKGKTRRWLVDWDVLPGAGRWENPLMGWASSADYMQGTQLAFPTKEEAIAFAEKQGWDYMVQKPQEPKIPPKNYAHNYVHVPGKLRIHHTK